MSEEETCIIPGCYNPKAEEHHVSSYQKEDQAKNKVPVCEDHHPRIHNGSDPWSLLLYRKLPVEKRWQDPPTIGRSSLQKRHKRLLIFDERIEQAFDEAEHHFDEAMENWRSERNTVPRVPFLEGFKYNSQVAQRFRHSTVSYPVDDGVYEHRTRPVQLRKVPGKGRYQLYLLPLSVSNDDEACLVALRAFREKLRRGKGLEGGRIVENHSKR